ncbi:unnamed protein product [Choristocarpus tenellus]
MMFNLQRSLQQHILHLCPAAAIVLCIRTDVGDPKDLLGLLSLLYHGQQALLHLDAASVDGFFCAIVHHLEHLAPAQALMKEISRGRRDIPPSLIDLFRKYRSQIPPLPGLWRVEVLEILANEEVNLEIEGENSSEEDALLDTGEQKSRLQRTLETGRSTVILAGPPAVMAIVGGQHTVSPDQGCAEPVALLLLLDGMLLTGFGASGALWGQQIAQCVGVWFFPMLILGAVSHALLYILLLDSLNKVEPSRSDVSGNNGSDIEEDKWCSTSTYAWGVIFAVLLSVCLAAAPTVLCLRWFNRAKQTNLQSVLVTADASPGAKARVALDKVDDGDKLRVPAT